MGEAIFYIIFIVVMGSWLLSKARQANREYASDDWLDKHK